MMNEKVIRMMGSEEQLTSILADETSKKRVQAIILIIRREFGFKDEEELNMDFYHDDIFDFVISLPTSRVKKEEDFEVLLKDVKMMSEKGRMAYVIPQEILRSYELLSFRKYLIDECLVDKVLLLNKTWAYDTEGSIVILFLSKEKKQRVKFINTINEVFVSWSFFPNNMWDSVDAISNYLYYDDVPHDGSLEGEHKYPLYDDTSDYFEDDFDITIDFWSYSHLELYDYSLNPESLVKGRPYQRNGFHLTECNNTWIGANPDSNRYSFPSFDDLMSDTSLEPIERKDMIAPVGINSGHITGKIISCENLKAVSYCHKLNASEIPFVETNREHYYELTGKAIVLSLIDNLYPTLVNAYDETLYVPMNGTMVVLPEDRLHEYIDGKEYKLDIAYIANELCKDYVRNQVHFSIDPDRYVDDIKSPVIKWKDLTSIRIYVPDVTDQQTSLERQQEIVDHENEERMKKLEMELGIERRELHLRKHRLANILGKLKDSFDLLNIIRKKQGGILKDYDRLNNHIEENVGQYFEQIQQTINKIAVLVAHFIDEQKANPEKIDLQQLLQVFRERYPKKNYRIDLFFADANSSYSIFVDKEMLIAGLENIINNAERHGFLDDTRKDYCLQISVDEKKIGEQKYVSLIVANNGAPMDSSVDKDKIFEWGYGAHTGLGLWELRRTIEEHFGGKIQVTTLPDDNEFTIAYEILIPKL